MNKGKLFFFLLAIGGIFAIYCSFISIGQKWVNSRYKLETCPSEVIDTNMDGLKKIKLAVSIDPNPPVTGDNTLRVLIKNVKTEANVRNIFIEGEAFYGSRHNRSVAFKLPFSREGDYEGSFPLVRAGSWRLILKLRMPDNQLILRNFYCTVRKG